VAHLPRGLDQNLTTLTQTSQVANASPMTGYGAKQSLAAAASSVGCNCPFPTKFLISVGMETLGLREQQRQSAFISIGQSETITLNPGRYSLSLTS
jgi:hypothetical protein